MSVLVTCSACRRKLKVRDESLGKRVKCPSCEEQFVARAEEDSADTPPPKSRREEQIRGGKPLPSRKAQGTRDDEEDDADFEPRRGGRTGRQAAGSHKGLVIGLIAGGVLLLAGVIVGAVLLLGKKDKPAEGGGGTKEVADTGPIPAADWKEFAPANGRYKILLPGTPVLQPAVAGPGTSNYTMFGLDVQKPPARIIFTVTYFDVTAAALREAPFEVRYAANRDRMVAKLNGKVLFEKDINGAGYRGKEYAIQGLEGNMLVERLYLTDGNPTQRIFSTKVVGKPLEPGKGIAARFLESFRIDAAPGPLVQNPPVFPPPINPPPARNPLPAHFIVAHGLPTKYLVLNPAGTVMASADQQMLKLWDPFNKNHQPRAQFTFLKDPVSALAFSADGKQLAVGRGATVELRDGVRGKVTATVPLRFREPGATRFGSSRSVAFAPDRPVLAVGMAMPAGGAIHGTVYLWDTGAGMEVRQFKAHDGEMWAVAYSPDGKTLATAGGDNLVKLWDTTTWAERAVLRGHTKRPHGLAFTRDGTRLASAGDDATVIVWDVAAGKEKGRLTGHKAAVLSVAYSPDDKLLATGGADGTLRLWDALAFAESRVLRPLGGGRVEAVAFHPDGVNLFNTHSGMIQRWELPKVLGP